MQLDLQPATLIKRYKRFLADVILADGSQTTIHCPNTGAMTGCAEPESTVYYSTSDNPKRKYPYTWELTHTSQGHWITVNTQRANQLVYEAFEHNRIEQFQNYTQAKPEVKYGENSRADLLLFNQQDKCFVEVKSVTLLKNEQGYFPDAVTTRGQKHLQELIEQVKLGNRACLFFCVQHSGINSVMAADFIDPKYAQLLSAAKERGVEIIAYKTTISATEISIEREIPVVMNDN